MTSLPERLKSCGSYDDALTLILTEFAADSGTIHRMGEDGALHLKAASQGIPEVVLNIVRTVPMGKGMAGLCAERGEAITACNIQSDASGDVRPGAKATGMEGAIVVPIFDGTKVVGTLGVANRTERTFSTEEQELLIAAGRVLSGLN